MRCEVDAVAEGKEKPVLVSVRALNEFCGAKPTGKHRHVFIFPTLC